MCSKGTAGAVLAAVLCGLVGCTTSDAHLKPEKPPEEYTVPPENDGRYSKPIEYPKDSMHQDIHLERLQNGGKKPEAGLRRPGAMGPQ
jgi:hypothetical protein